MDGGSHEDGPFFWPLGRSRAPRGLPGVAGSTNPCLGLPGHPHTELRQSV